jgi:hypothetical protein
MDLEERTLDDLGDRCEECGATLTRAELEQALAGGPLLCTIHRTETVPLDESVADEELP